jgi:16S rRNA processing protein RimM
MRFVPVGRVVSAHGVRGEVKFWYYNETRKDSLKYPSFFVDQSGKTVELKPSGIRLQGNAFVIKFKGLETVESVQFLIKKELSVREDDLPGLDEGEYYDYQLIGLDVVTGDDKVIGKVKGVMHTMANDILIVDGVREVLVPMTENHIVNISPKDGLVRIREEALVE